MLNNQRVLLFVACHFTRLSNRLEKGTSSRHMATLPKSETILKSTNLLGMVPPFLPTSLAPNKFISGIAQIPKSAVLMVKSPAFYIECHDHP